MEVSGTSNLPTYLPVCTRLYLFVPGCRTYYGVIVTFIRRNASSLPLPPAPPLRSPMLAGLSITPPVQSALPGVGGLCSAFTSITDRHYLQYHWCRRHCLILQGQGLSMPAVGGYKHSQRRIRHPSDSSSGFPGFRVSAD